MAAMTKSPPFLPTRSDPRRQRCEGEIGRELAFDCAHADPCRRFFTQELPKNGLPTEAKEAQSRRREKRLFTARCLWLVGPGLNSAHNAKIAGSNPALATIDDEGLADAKAANPFGLPRLHPGIG
jgi:hypothetical protein